ncbi:MAG: hypothetical protein EOP91_07480 [Lysobacteraceae bacterium]|nr:MAG: hypothetical protein EOP91_07480 [Xanthomonadaceae bacterium]
MFDRNTLIIAYDPMRGEPRGPRKRGLGDVFARGRGLLDKFTAYDYVFRSARHPSAADSRAQARGTITFDAGDTVVEPLPKFPAEQLGDCIDCTMCVQVCPVGIDIRNGLQYECIACGLCIDACDNVMDLMGFKRGLIRYSTQNAIDGKASRVLRPRIVVYGLLLLGLIAAFAWGIGNRSPLIAEVLRDRNALYRVGADGIDNGYTLKLVNKTDAAQRYRVTLESATAGIALAAGTPATITAEAEQVLSLPLQVSAPETVRGRHDLRFVIETVDGKTRETVASSFFGPL